MKYKRDYTFVERDGIDLWVVRILTGPFCGTQYAYGKVSVIEKADGPILKFNFKVFEYLDEDPTNLDEFKNTLGVILEDIVENNESTPEKN